MASILQVEQIQGPTSGASANTIQIPSGQTLDINGTLSGDGSALTGIGKVLQVVFQEDDSVASTTNQGTNFHHFYSATITPSSTSSKIICIANFQVARTTLDGAFFVFKRSIGGATATVVADGDDSTGRVPYHTNLGSSREYDTISTSMHYVDSPNTTSSVQYTVAGSNRGGGTLYLNRSSSDNNDTSRGRGLSTIMLMEIAG